MENKEIQSNDVGVQVKTSNFISLQRKVTTITAETQTPNLETDDTYEAALLRGRPLKVVKNPEKPTILKFCLNMKKRQRSSSGLSARFKTLPYDEYCPLGRCKILVKQ